MDNGMESSGKPKLLVLASTYPRWEGDVEPGFVHELAKRLTDSFAVTVLCPRSPGAELGERLNAVRVRRYRYAPAKLETLVNDGGIVNNLRRSAWKWLLVPTFFLALLWNVWWIVRTERPDVIHAHWLLPQGLAAVLLSMIAEMPPIVVTSHGADLFTLKTRPLQVLKRMVVTRAAAVTVVSHAMRDELVRIGADPNKVKVQPMGVDLVKHFTPNDDVQRTPCEILFVGRLVEKKGLRILIEAMPMILAAHPSVTLCIAGFGPDEQALRTQVAALNLDGRVNFLGAVAQAELPTLYRRAALFVAPFVRATSGDQEGLGLVTVESAGCGCPIVVSDLPAVRDVFENGDHVKLVPPGDAGALAEACIASLQLPADELRLNASRCRDRVIEGFDWERRAAAYASLLRKVVP